MSAPGADPVRASQETPVAARPFRFAVQTFSASSASEWRDRARQIEGTGYAALHLADHFLGPGPALESHQPPPPGARRRPGHGWPPPTRPSTLRIGCRVFCNDYRHPVMLAKEAATLDLLSEGRLELGLGAGWLQGRVRGRGGHHLRSARPCASSRLEPRPWRSSRQLMAEGQVELQGQALSGVGLRGRAEAGAEPAPAHHDRWRRQGACSQLAGREADIVSFNFNNRSGVIGPDGVKQLHRRAHGPEGRAG